MASSALRASRSSGSPSWCGLNRASRNSPVSRAAAAVRTSPPSRNGTASRQVPGFRAAPRVAVLPGPAAEVLGKLADQRGCAVGGRLDAGACRCRLGVPQLQQVANAQRRRAGTGGRRRAAGCANRRAACLVSYRPGLSVLVPSRPAGDRCRLPACGAARLRVRLDPDRRAVHGPARQLQAAVRLLLGRAHGDHRCRARLRRHPRPIRRAAGSRGLGIPSLTPLESEFRRPGSR
jgi:hypothetical protein